MKDQTSKIKISQVSEILEELYEQSDSIFKTNNKNQIHMDQKKIPGGIRKTFSLQNVN